MPDCATCNDTGQVCDLCRHADGDCICEDGPELVGCDQCAGMADREASTETNAEGGEDVSKLAQSVQQAVDELTAGTADNSATGASDMAKTKAKKRAKKVKAAKVQKIKAAKTPRAKRAKPTKTGEGRVLKTYRLVDGIPDDLRKGSAGMAILEAIKSHGSPTSHDLREALPKSFPKPTLQFYLGKFQRENIVTSKG